MATTGLIGNEVAKLESEGETYKTSDVPAPASGMESEPTTVIHGVE